MESSLTELYLQRNRLQTLPRVVFNAETVDERTTSALRVVDLSSNPLGSYVDSLRQSVGLRQTLGVLRLRDVGLTRWPTGLLHGLDALTTLDVAENRLTTIPPSSLADLDRLERLDASLNRISGVDPWRLMSPSSRQPPSMDLSGNPLDCTCGLTALCSHLFSVDGPTRHNTTRTTTTASRTLYSCRTPLEWRGVALVTFCADATAQCSTLPTAVLAASVSIIMFVVTLVVVVVVCRRCTARHRPIPASTKAAAAAAAAAAAGKCRSDSCYQFVDETSLTSSSNSSNSAATTTTSAVPVPLPAQHSSLKPPAISHQHNHHRHADDFLLANATRQWL